MKVVLFCGGLGMRMREGASNTPKPMVMVGDRPLLWHVMRYYAHFGHNDFVLCLGYGGQAIKDFYLNYDETKSNDFMLDGSTNKVTLSSTDISDWRITFVDTGLHSSIGERLRRARPFIEGEEMFMANYSDVLTDAPLDQMVAKLQSSTAAALLMAVPVQSSHHAIGADEDGVVTGVTPMSDLDLWENGGYLILRSEVLDDVHKDEDLVEGAITRLVPKGRLVAYPYKGFWCSADTQKERSQLEDMYHRGNRPWMVWDKSRSSTSRPDEVAAPGLGDGPGPGSVPEPAGR